jgi:hypothetical protein
MRLALVSRGLDQGLVVEPLGSRQDRGRDLDEVVVCERANGERRRGVDHRESIGEQRLGGGFDVLHQALEDVVEQPDLVIREIDRAVDEQVGDAAQSFDPSRDGSMRERSLQLVEQAFGSGNGFRTHGFTLSWSISDRRQFLRPRKIW